MKCYGGQHRRRCACLYNECRVCATPRAESKRTFQRDLREAEEEQHRTGAEMIDDLEGDMFLNGRLNIMQSYRQIKG